MGTSAINENVFDSNSFEEHFTLAVKIKGGGNNVFNLCRVEMPYLQFLFEFDNSRFNKFLDSDGVSHHMRNNKFREVGMEILILLLDILTICWGK